MSTINIEIEKAETVAHDLADLLCWWQGFKMRLKVNTGYAEHTIADNGIDAVLTLRLKIHDALNMKK